MDALEKINTLNILNEIIRNAVDSECVSEMVALIVLSARAALYLRNNDLKKFKKIENEIDEKITKHKNYLNILKKTG